MEASQDTVLKRVRKQEKPEKNATKYSKDKKSYKFIFITIAAIIALIVIVGVIVFFVVLRKDDNYGKNKEDNNGDKDSQEQPDNPEPPEQPDNPESPEQPDKPEIIIENSPKEKEFDIITRPGHLKEITVVQKSNDEIKKNDKVIQMQNIRKTDYLIYIMTEENPDEDHTNYYTKMYTGSISIKSECSSTEGECQLQPLLDLTLKPKVENRARILENPEKLKDSPIALCFFNITDNHIITTITCPESFPEIKKTQMLLDLYFFRPPASKRIDRENDNITLSIIEDKKTKRTHIREINGGICNIYNNFGSLCTTDMNTTLDSEKNLLTYDEEAITTINYDDNNSYIKKKITNLVDISNNIKEEDIENYKNSLNILLPLIKPYLKEDLQFTDDDFSDFNDRYKNKTKRFIPKKTRNTFRKLDDQKMQYIQESEILSYRAKGIESKLKLEINPGINSDIIGAYGAFYLDKEKYIYSSIQNISTINKLINKLASISKAGNQLATELYDQIIDKLEQILNEITIQTNNLNELLLYYDINKIFNSTLSLYAYNKLSNDIIKVSNELLSKLSGIFTNIKSGDIRTNAQFLQTDIYNYINQMNSLITKMLNSLEELTNTLITKNNTFTAITNYYLNDTSASYVNIIKKMKSILNNYFIDEYNLIYQKIENLMLSFKESTNDSLKKNLSYIKELYNNLLDGSYIINNITDQDFEKVLSNLDNSYKYPKDIIIKINNYIIEMSQIKENGYFISDEDIDNFNKTFISLFEKADEVAKKLDNVELIDKVFDEIMTKFRDNYIYTISYMEQLKSSKFYLEENVLKNSSFTANITKQMEDELKSVSDEILDKIKITNNIEKIRKYLNLFLENNLDNITTIISDLELIFSEEQLKLLSDVFELSLNLSLQRITNETKKNIDLAKKYYDEYYNVVNDEESLKRLVQNYMLRNPKHPNYIGSTIYQMIEYDDIKEKEYTSAYLAKYNSFMANLNYSQEYLINQLYFDIVNEHREKFDIMKDYLQSILNHKLNEKFYYFDEVDFYNNHIKIVEKLNNRLNKYFSQEAFDKKYLKIINESINLNKQSIDNAKEYINSKHNFIKSLNFYDKDYSNDVCIVFKRKVCYGCKNCVSYTFFYDRICIVLSPYQYNYLEVKKIEFDSMKNFSDFENSFIQFETEINTKVEQYNIILGELAIYIDTLPYDEEIKNISYSDFEPLEKWINNILVKKYQDEIIKSTYNYYQENIKGKIEIMFDDIFNKWQTIYTNLSIDVDNNKENIKYSLFEFSMIGSIYRSIITAELTENYFNSIILFQRSEFNYTISYYYNYLMKLIDKSYKYIINNIQISEYDLNNTIKERKEEIKSIFDILTRNISYSENEYLTIEKQINILQVNDNDFFRVKYIMEKNIQETDEKLEDMVEDILKSEISIGQGDEYSLAMRLYLENKELGKLIDTYYKPIDKEEFISLNLNKFKDILKENWVFDEGDFIYILNNALFETNKVIKNDLSIKIENYTNIIENEITKNFGDSIENIIDELYAKTFSNLTRYVGGEIQENILDILDVIQKRIRNEAKRIDENSGIYNLNSKKIKEKIDNYKNIIISKLNDSVFSVLDKFNENIYNNVYINCIETRLYQFLNETKKAGSSSEFGEYKLVNSSYNIGEYIYNLTNVIIDNYKTIIRKKIDFKYNEYYSKINSILDITSLNNYIVYILSITFEDNFSNSFIKDNNCSSIKCDEFDFKSETITDINNTINVKFNNIKKIMESKNTNNYRVNFACPLDFTNSGNNVIRPILDSFKRFLSFENQEQGTLINEYIQNYIKSNLDDFLNNVVPTFGNPFFERIIDYNINFKIVDLYQNLRYSLAQTMLYYYILNEVRDVGDLPNDLKIRLYQLNDLDLTIKIKVREIKKLLEKKLSDLIEDLKDCAKETYIYYLKENDIIKSNFSPLLLEKIDYNLEEIMEDLDKKYQNVLEKYLKEKFMNSFSEILEEKTEAMLEVFYIEKNKLIEKFDILFSSKADKDLNEVNKKINHTLITIQNYTNFADTFEISTDVINFFMKYGNSTLVPLFLQFDKDLNNKMKQLIMKSINEESSLIESLNYNKFNSYIKMVENNLLNDYINIINDAANSYGITKISYESNLNYTKNKIYKKLVDNSEENDLVKESKQRVESKDVEETLNLLKNKALNNYNGMNNLDAFKNFNKKTNDYINLANLEYKNINEIIANNKYNDEISFFLFGKVNRLYNILYNYYYQINSRFYSYENYLVYNMSNIYTHLYYCYYYTRLILNSEYQKIYNETKPINHKYINNNVKKFNDISYGHDSEHMNDNATVSLDNLREYTEFTLDLILDNNYFKRPKVKGRIVDKSIPRNIILDIYSKCGECCQEGHLYNITLNDSNYTMTLEYDTKTSSINITTYTSIDKYTITEIIYKNETKELKINENFDTILANFSFCLSDKNNFTIKYQNTTKISAKNYTNEPTIIIK